MPADKNLVIRSSILLKRCPITLRPPTRFEKAYSSIISTTNQYDFHHDFAFFEKKRIGVDDESNEDSDDMNTINKTREDPTADDQGDNKLSLRDLSRKPNRSLYLLFKYKTESKRSKADSNFRWNFPVTPKIGSTESLDSMAKWYLSDILGTRFSGTPSTKEELKEKSIKSCETWLVGRAPAGYYEDPLTNNKVFMMKSQIYSGQIQLPPKEYLLSKSSPFYEFLKDEPEILDFAWLTKQEISDIMSSDPKRTADKYIFQQVGDCLTED